MKMKTRKDSTGVVTCDDQVVLECDDSDGLITIAVPVKYDTEDNKATGDGAVEDNDSERNNNSNIVENGWVFLESWGWRHRIPMSLSLILFVIIYDVLVITIKYIRKDIFTQKELAFAPTTIIVLAEVAKLILSLCVLRCTEHNCVKGLLEELKRKLFLDWRDMLRIMLPAFLYVLQNNFLHFAAHELTLATFEITHQLKIISAAIFGIVILKRKLSPMQWFSLFLLVSGVIMVQITQTDPIIPTEMILTIDGEGNGELLIFHNPNHRNKLDGFLFSISACLMSGFCGTFLEHILKENPSVSIWMRNVQLAIWSIPFSLLACSVEYEKIQANGFFYGYNAITWILVLLYAVVGISVGAVLRHADVILKSFATCLAIIIACLLSHFFFQAEFSLLFGVGVGLVTISIFVYSYSSKRRGYVPVK